MPYQPVRISSPSTRPVWSRQSQYSPKIQTVRSPTHQISGNVSIPVRRISSQHAERGIEIAGSSHSSTGTRFGGTISKQDASRHVDVAPLSLSLSPSQRGGSFSSTRVQIEPRSAKPKQIEIRPEVVHQSARAVPKISSKVSTLNPTAVELPHNLKFGIQELRNADREKVENLLITRALIFARDNEPDKAKHYISEYDKSRIFGAKFTLPEAEKHYNAYEDNINKYKNASAFGKVINKIKDGMGNAWDAISGSTNSEVAARIFLPAVLAATNTIGNKDKSMIDEAFKEGLTRLAASHGSHLGGVVSLGVPTISDIKSMTDLGGHIVRYAKSLGNEESRKKIMDIIQDAFNYTMEEMGLSNSARDTGRVSLPIEEKSKRLEYIQKSKNPYKGHGIQLAMLQHVVGKMIDDMPPSFARGAVRVDKDALKESMHDWLGKWYGPEAVQFASELSSIGRGGFHLRIPERISKPEMPKIDIPNEFSKILPSYEAPINLRMFGSPDPVDIEIALTHENQRDRDSLKRVLDRNIEKINKLIKNREEKTQLYREIKDVYPSSKTYYAGQTKQNLESVIDREMVKWYQNYFGGNLFKNMIPSPIVYLEQYPELETIIGKQTKGINLLDAEINQSATKLAKAYMPQNLDPSRQKEFINAYTAVALNEYNRKKMLNDLEMENPTHKPNRSHLDNLRKKLDASNKNMQEWLEKYNNEENKDGSWGKELGYWENLTGKLAKEVENIGSLVRALKNMKGKRDEAGIVYNVLFKPKDPTDGLYNNGRGDPNFEQLVKENSAQKIAEYIVKQDPLDTTGFSSTLEKILSDTNKYRDATVILAKMIQDASKANNMYKKRDQYLTANPQPEEPMSVDGVDTLKQEIDKLEAQFMSQESKANVNMAIRKQKLHEYDDTIERYEKLLRDQYTIDPPTNLKRRLEIIDDTMRTPTIYPSVAVNPYILSNRTFTSSTTGDINTKKTKKSMLDTIKDTFTRAGGAAIQSAILGTIPAIVNFSTGGIKEGFSLLPPPAREKSTQLIQGVSPSNPKLDLTNFTKNTSKSDKLDMLRIYLSNLEKPKTYSSGNGQLLGLQDENEPLNNNNNTISTSTNIHLKMANPPRKIHDHLDENEPLNNNNNTISTSTNNHLKFANSPRKNKFSLSDDFFYSESDDNDDDNDDGNVVLVSPQKGLIDLYEKEENDKIQNENSKALMQIPNEIDRAVSTIQTIPIPELVTNAPQMMKISINAGINAGLTEAKNQASNLIIPVYTKIKDTVDDIKNWASKKITKVFKDVGDSAANTISRGTGDMARSVPLIGTTIQRPVELGMNNVIRTAIDATTKNTSAYINALIKK